MPIRKENRDRYPSDWKAISQRVRFDRAGGRCECEGECGLRHVVNDEGAQLDLPPSCWIPSVPGGRCAAMNGEKHPTTKSVVVLTVAHLDHTPENCDNDNLKAMCQRCHNSYDAPMRRRGILERERIKRATGDLFAKPPP